MRAPPSADRARERGRCALLHAALALLVTACNGSAVQASVEFDAARAWADLVTIVGFGERFSGSDEIERLRKYLEAELTAAGLEPVREAFESPTPIGELPFVNLWVDLPADDPQAPLVVIATHYDAKRLGPDFQAANDGGSGTAVLLELARVLAAEPDPRPLAYRLLFLDGEEAIRPEWRDPDNRYGSRYHVARLMEAGELQRVRACVLLDMVGDANLRLFRESYSDRELLELFFVAAEENGLGRHVRGRRLEILDDHLSFLAAGIPSVNLIDFHYGPDNAYWHTNDDTLEHCSEASLDVAGRIVLHGLRKLEQRFAD